MRQTQGQLKTFNHLHFFFVLGPYSLSTLVSLVHLDFSQPGALWLPARPMLKTVWCLVLFIALCPLLGVKTSIMASPSYSKPNILSKRNTTTCYISYQNVTLMFYKWNFIVNTHNLFQKRLILPVLETVFNNWIEYIVFKSSSLKYNELFHCSLYLKKYVDNRDYFSPRPFLKLPSIFYIKATPDLDFLPSLWLQGLGSKCSVTFALPSLLTLKLLPPMLAFLVELLHLLTIQLFSVNHSLVAKSSSFCDPVFCGQSCRGQMFKPTHYPVPSVTPARWLNNVPSPHPEHVCVSS